MKTYKAMKVVTLAQGNVSLTEDQAKTRAHNIKGMGDGVYQIVNPVQFKAGEKFGYDGEISKEQADDLVPASIVDNVADVAGKIGRRRKKRTSE